MTTPQFDPSSRVSATEYETALRTPSPSSPEVETTGKASNSKKLSLKLPKGFWGWQLLWLMVLLGFGTMGTGALLWLLVTPPPPNCEEISPLSDDGDRLYCADAVAKSGDLEEVQAAFNLVESWPEDHPLQPQAQQMMQQWARLLVVIADQKIDQGNLQGALDLISIVPESSPAYSKVEKAITKWKNDWDKGQQLYNKAQESLKKQEWSQAFSFIQGLAKLNNAHWREKRFNELVDRMSIEKQGYERLKEARAMAKKDTPTQLEEAIQLAYKVDSKLYVSTVAREEVKNWSQRLIELAREKLKQRNLDGVLDIAQRVPKYSPLYQNAQDIILLGRVQNVVSTQASGKPVIQQILVLLEGKSALEQSSIEAPLYEDAQIQPEELEGQIRDFMDLQLSTTMAKLGHPFALQLAINQAQMIQSDRPRRVHAQTLVAHWRKEIQRIEDRPYIILARKLAESEDVDGFRAAVAQATQVNLGRPLRVEAQTLVAEWTKRIQIIEDQPLLTEALALAEAGKLSAAIDKASEIGKGRALYGEARENIDEWVTTIQIAEDRPILNRAYSLASKGSLSAAIKEASKIRYGRALYYEAQNVIARWAAERDAYWAAQKQKERQSSYRSSTTSSQSSSGYSSSSGSTRSSGYSSGSYSSGSYSSGSYSSGSYSSGSYSSGSYSSGSSSSSGYSSYSGSSSSSGYSGYSGSSSSSGYSGYSGSSSSSGYSGYSGSSSSSSAPAPSSYSAPAPASSGGGYSAPDANLFLE